MDYDPDFCPLTLEKPTMEQLSGHMWFMCNPCSARKIHERTGGREMVFVDGPPDWAPKPEPSPMVAEKKSRKQLRKEAQAAEKEQEKPVFQKMLDKMNNQGMTKREATMEIIQDTRKAHSEMVAKGEVAAPEKTRVERSMMAWVPPAPFKVSGKSVYNRADHKRYVAIISNNVNRTKQLRFDTNKLEIDSMDEKLAPERQKFADHVDSVFAKAKKIPYLWMEHAAKRYMKDRAFERLRYLCEKYSKEPVTEVHWPRSTESALMGCPKVVEFLEYGRFRQLKVPDVRRKATFKQDLAEVVKKFPLIEEDKENRIEKDCHIEEFAREKGVYVTADSGTLRRLFTSSSLCFDEELVYPVTVTRVLNEGSLENLAYIGKPVSSNPLNNPTLSRRYVKFLIKDGLGYLKDNLDQPEPSEAPKPKEPKPSTSTAVPDEDDLLGNILGGMNETEGEIGEKKEDNPIPAKSSRTKKKYTLFSFRDNGEPSIIVRSNNDGMENNTRISWTHKLEYVPNICAEKIREEEWIWMFATNLFKSAQMHLQFRVHYHDYDCLQIERFPPAQNVFHAATPDQKCLIGERTERIANLIDEISKLHKGNYLLKEEDGSMVIYTEFDPESDAEEGIVSANLKPDMYAKPVLVPPFSQCFNGIDNHLILTWHLIQGRIPGSLPPFDWNVDRPVHHQRKDGDKPKTRRGGRGGGGDRGGWKRRKLMQ